MFPQASSANSSGNRGVLRGYLIALPVRQSTDCFVWESLHGLMQHFQTSGMGLLAGGGGVGGRSAPGMMFFHVAPPSEVANSCSSAQPAPGPGTQEAEVVTIQPCRAVANVSDMTPPVKPRSKLVAEA